MIRHNWILTILAIGLFIILADTVNADDTIRGSYCYKYGDGESLKEAREITKQLAVRNALESYRAFVVVTTAVKNFQLTNDLIQVISSGYLKDLKSVKHTEKDREICDIIVAHISPEVFDNILHAKIEELSKQKSEIQAAVDSYNEYSINNDSLKKKFFQLYHSADEHMTEARLLAKSESGESLIHWEARIGSMQNEIGDANLAAAEAAMNVMLKILENDIKQYTLNRPYTDIFLSYEDKYHKVILDLINNVDELTDKSFKEIGRSMDATKYTDSIDYHRTHDKLAAAHEATSAALIKLLEANEKHLEMNLIIIKQVLQMKTIVDQTNAAK